MLNKVKKKESLKTRLRRAFFIFGNSNAYLNLKSKKKKDVEAERLYKILKLISKQLGYYNSDNKLIIGNPKSLFKIVPSYEFYGSLYRQKQLSKIKDMRSSMHFNAVTYFENLEKMN